MKSTPLSDPYRVQGVKFNSAMSTLPDANSSTATFQQRSSLCPGPDVTIKNSDGPSPRRKCDTYSPAKKYMHKRCRKRTQTRYDTINKPKHLNICQTQKAAPISSGGFRNFEGGRNAISLVVIFLKIQTINYCICLLYGKRRFIKKRYEALGDCPTALPI